MNMWNETSIWHTLPAGSWAAILALGRPVQFAKGQTIFLRGDPGDYILALQSGLVEIAITQSSGRKSVLNHMGEGEILGEIALLDGKPRTADATALSAVEAVLIPRARIAAHLRENPEALLKLVDALCDKVRNASDMFEAQAQVSASAKLARCLLALARKWGEPRGDEVTLTQTFSQTEIGAFAGLARENVNRHMRAWADEGLLQFEAGVLSINDMDRLEDLAEF